VETQKRYKTLGYAEIKRVDELPRYHSQGHFERQHVHLRAWPVASSNFADAKHHPGCQSSIPHISRPCAEASKSVQPSCCCLIASLATTCRKLRRSKPPTSTSNIPITLQIWCLRTRSHPSSVFEPQLYEQPSHASFLACIWRQHNRVLPWSSLST
jgi:hypothetical protein